MTTQDFGGAAFGGRGRQADRTFDLRGRVAFGLALAGLLVGVCLYWATTAQLSGAVIAQGTVVVDEAVKEVQHRDGGTITEIAVRAGDEVAEGQVLVRLDDVQIRAERAIVSGQLLELTARRARLLAERDALVEIGFPEGFATGRGAELAAGETTLFEGNLVNRGRQKEQLELQLAQLVQEIEGLSAQRAALAEEITLVTGERDKLVDLSGRQLIEASRVYAISRELARMLGEEGAIDANIARAEGRMSEVRLQILSIDETARTEAQRELRGLEASIAELGERLAAIEERLAQTVIRAPIGGTVNELNVTTVGGVVTSAQTLATIVPVDADLTIEVRFRTVDVDQVSVGRPAKLRLSAFNQRVTPEISGEIVRVAAASQRDPATGEIYFLGEIAVTDASALDGIDLLPGMPVEVFVETRPVSALSYLVKPLTDQFSRALREE